MKINTETNKVATRGVQQKYRYTVANSPKVMQMLGDKLYSNKELAPVRELTTNAIDSHIISGNSDKAIEFSLPTAIDETPTFRIRDYGEGMSEERLINLYRVYGLSSKDEDNEQQGAYGLGSKSPFAYCDSFTTISYYNGKKYTYINSKSSVGGFTLNKIGECDTMEHNGVEISFPVKISDVVIFKQNLENILKRCPVPYKCNIPLNINKNELEVLLEDKNKKWIIYKDSANYRDYSKAIMGYIEYPIDSSHFNNDIKRSNLLKMNIELFFDIGEIEMDISREGLQYNQLTINAIKNRLDEINIALSFMIKEKIESAASLYEARELYETLKNICDWVVNNAYYKWNDKIIETYEQISNKLINKYGYSVYYHKRWGKFRYKNLINIWNKELKFNDSLKIIFDDLNGKGTRSRVTQYLKSKSEINGGLVFDINYKTDILEILGIPENKTILASSLSKTTRVRTQSLTKSYSATKIVCGYNHLQACNITKSLGQNYYLVSKRDNIKFDGFGWATLGSIKTIIELAKKTNIIIPLQIYCVIPSKEKYVEKWGWKKFDEYIKKELSKKTFNRKKICLARLNDQESSFFKLFIKTSANVNNKTLFGKYLKFLRFIDKCYYDKKLISLIELNKYINLGVENTTKIDLKAIEKRVFYKYPLLTLLKDGYYYNDKEKNLLINETLKYVNLVEKC